MKPSSSEHSSGRESVTVTARPFKRPRPTGCGPFQPLHDNDFTRRREPSQRRTSPEAGATAPRLQPTTARIRRSAGSETVTVRKQGPGSVQDAVTVNGERASETLNGCVTPCAYSKCALHPPSFASLAPMSEPAESTTGPSPESVAV